jgi:hypothetical protein
MLQVAMVMVWSGGERRGKESATTALFKTDSMMRYIAKAQDVFPKSRSDVR